MPKEFSPIKTVKIIDNVEITVEQEVDEGGNLYEPLLKVFAIFKALEGSGNFVGDEGAGFSHLHEVNSIRLFALPRPPFGLWGYDSKRCHHVGFLRACAEFSHMERVG